jgi:hypothetical protein
MAHHLAAIHQSVRPPSLNSRSYHKMIITIYFRSLAGCIPNAHSHDVATYGLVAFKTEYQNDGKQQVHRIQLARQGHRSLMFEKKKNRRCTSLAICGMEYVVVEIWDFWLRKLLGDDYCYCGLGGVSSTRGPDCQALCQERQRMLLSRVSCHYRIEPQSPNLPPDIPSLFLPSLPFLPNTLQKRSVSSPAPVTTVVPSGLVLK